MFHGRGPPNCTFCEVLHAISTAAWDRTSYDKFRVPLAGVKVNDIVGSSQNSAILLQRSVSLYRRFNRIAYAMSQGLKTRHHRGLYHHALQRLHAKTRRQNYVRHLCEAFRHTNAPQAPYTRGEPRCRYLAKVRRRQRSQRQPVRG